MKSSLLQLFFNTYTFNWFSYGIYIDVSISLCFIFHYFTIFTPLCVGHPRRALDSPHCVHSHCNILYHTKVLRLYYLRQFGTDGNNNPHLLHKTFHVPLPVTTSAVSMNQGRERSLFPGLYMEEVMSKIRRWISLTGSYCGVHITLICLHYAVTVNYLSLFRFTIIICVSLIDPRIIF